MNVWVLVVLMHVVGVRDPMPVFVGVFDTSILCEEFRNGREEFFCTEQPVLKMKE